MGYTLYFSSNYWNQKSRNFWNCELVWDPGICIPNCSPVLQQYISIYYSDRFDLKVMFKKGFLHKLYQLLRIQFTSKCSTFLHRITSTYAIIYYFHYFHIGRLLVARNTFCYCRSIKSKTIQHPETFGTHGACFMMKLLVLATFNLTL